MELYGLKTCDTCRKALKSLPEAQLRDVRSDGVPDAVLDRALDRFGADLVNTKSTTWRGLDADERARAPRDLLRDHPTLMKRPLIVAGDAMHLGWNDAVKSDLGVA